MGGGKKWAHNLTLAKMALLMGRLDGFSLVLPACSQVCTPLEGQQDWKAQNGIMQMSCSWSHWLGAPHLLSTWPLTLPQAELSASCGILRQGSRGQRRKLQGLIPRLVTGTACITVPTFKMGSPWKWLGGGPGEETQCSNGAQRPGHGGWHGG